MIPLVLLLYQAQEARKRALERMKDTMMGLTETNASPIVRQTRNELVELIGV